MQRAKCKIRNSAFTVLNKSQFQPGIASASPRNDIIQPPWFWSLEFWVLILFRVSDLGFRISLYPFLSASICVVTCNSVSEVGYAP